MSHTVYSCRFQLLLALAVLVAASAGLSVNTAINIDEEEFNTCIENLSQNVQSTCRLNLSDTAYDEAVTGAVKDFVAQCLQLQVQPARAVRIMAPKIPPVLDLLQRHAAEYEAATGVRVVLNAVSAFQVAEEARQELVFNLTDFSDGWVMDPSATGMIASLGGFRSLDEYIPEDPNLAWTDISLFFRQAAAVYDGKVIGIPLDGDLFLLYYRRDLFERYNLSVPATWDDLVTLATRMNGTDTDGDGHGDLYGICLDNGSPVCKASFLLIAMAAPYLQYKGTAQGVFFEPEKMEPLVDNAAMEQALQHYIALWRLQPKSGISCGGSNAAFRRGQCLMTINWGDDFKANAMRTMGRNMTAASTSSPAAAGDPNSDNSDSRFGEATPPIRIESKINDDDDVDTNVHIFQRNGSNASTVDDGNYSNIGSSSANSISTSSSSSSGRISDSSSVCWDCRGMRLGVSRLPGASRVLDRTTGRLVSCDSSPSLCPYARQQQLYDGRITLVNFAPYSAFGGWLGSVSQLAPPAYQRRVYDFFTSLVVPVNSWRDVLDANTTIDPYRISQVQDDGDNGEDFGRWLAAGYERDATRDYLRAIREALGSENTVLDNRLQYVDMPYRLYYEYALHNLTWNATPGVTVEAVLKTLQAQLTEAMARAAAATAGRSGAGSNANGTVDGLAELRVQYCKLIGCRITSSGGSGGGGGSTSGSSQTATGEGEGGGGGGGGTNGRRNLSKGTIAAVVVVPVMVVLLMVAALGVSAAVRRAAKYRQRLLSHVKAPGVGPATTLLITDIESSTTLWELLPEEAMSRAVELHHEVLRASLSKYSGYESATEGDSFICAFHSASDAVQCAVEIQLALLSAPWPPELPACGALPAVAEVALTPGPRCSEVTSMLSADSRSAGLSSRLINHSNLMPLHFHSQHHHTSKHHRLHMPPPPRLPQPPTQLQKHRLRLMQRLMGRAPAVHLFGKSLSLNALAVPRPEGVTEAALAGTGMLRQGDGSIPTAVGDGCGGDGVAAANATNFTPHDVVSDLSCPLAGLVLRTDDDLQSTVGIATAVGTSHRLHLDPPPMVSVLKAAASVGHNGCECGGVGCCHCCGTGFTTFTDFAPANAADTAAGATAAASREVAAATAAAGGCSNRFISFPCWSQMHHQPEASGIVLDANVVCNLNGTVPLYCNTDIEAPPAPLMAVGCRGFSGLLVERPRRISCAAASSDQPASAKISSQLQTPLPQSATAKEAQGSDGGVDQSRVACLLDLIRLVWLGSSSNNCIGDAQFGVTRRPDAQPPVLAANSCTSSSSPTPSASLSVCGSTAAVAAATAEVHVSMSPFTVGGIPMAATPIDPQSCPQVFLPPLRSLPSQQLQQQQQQQQLGSASPVPSMFRTMMVRKRRDGGDGAQGFGNSADGGGDVTPGGGGGGSSSAFQAGAGRGSRVDGGSGGGGVTLYRGLRVRIGMASGLQRTTDLSYVSGEARMHYSGPCIQLARAIVSAAAGGQVLLSDATFALLRAESAATLLGTKRMPFWSGGGGGGVLVLHMGHHELLEGEKSGLGPQQVYQAIPQALVGRLALLPPLKVRSTLTTGVLDAPVEKAAVAFTYAVGADSLMAWDAGTARRSLALLEEAFAQEVMRVRSSAERAGLYIAEASGGLLLAIFTEANLAVSCCLDAVAVMPGLPWPEGLLRHALCEELTVAGVDEGGNPVERVLFRGLRIKSGLDYGPIRAVINAATGRLSYKGRVMNRAARIASKATAGQVLCSRDLWHSVCNPPSSFQPLLTQPITAISLGTSHLKGVPEPVELMVCRYTPPSARMSSITGLAGGSEITIQMTDGLGI